MQRSFILLLILLLALCGTHSLAEGYNYVTAGQLKEKIETAQPLSLLDIQYEGAYKNRHFKQAIATYAYPVKTDASRALIDAKLSSLNASGPIVIISRRGGGGAMRAAKHLQTKGIDAQRLLILKSGMQGWPYPNMIENTEDK